MTALDDFNKNQTSAALQAASPDAGSWLQAFGQSTVGNVGEFFGFEKSPATQKWEAENPTSSFLSGALGYAVPYVGWERAGLKALPALGKAIEGIGNFEKAPVLTKAVREVAKYAPLEAGRIGIAAGFGDRPISDTVGGAAFDLGTIGLLSAGGQALAEYGKKRIPLSLLVPGADSALPPQLQMRAAREYLPKVTDPKLADTINNRLNEFEKVVRLEEVAPGFRYVSDLEGTSGKDINRLFDVSRSSSGIDRKLFISGGRGFKGVTDEAGKLTVTPSQQIADTWKSAGFNSLKEDAPFVQFPRFISTKKPQGAGFVQASIRRDMNNIADSTWMSREKEDGLFVIAKKIAGGDKPAAGDSWVMFKTDTPGRFAPVQEEWAQKQASKQAWLARDEKAIKPTGSAMYDFAERVTQQFPMMNFMSHVKPGTKFADLAETLGNNMGLDKVSGAKQAFGDFFNRYFVPSAYQFQKSPRANWVNAMSRAIYDEADRLSQTTMFGEHALQDKNLWRASIQGGKFEGSSIKSKLDKLTDADMGDVWKAWNEQWDAKALSQAHSQGLVSDAIKDFLTHVADIDDKMIAQIQTTQAAYGENLFKPLKNHYMITRTWNGDWRVPIHNEDGQLIYMAAGKTKKGAETAAEGVVKDSGKAWTTKEAVPADRNIESPIQLSGYFNDMALNRPDYFEAAKLMEKQYQTSRPNFMEQRQNVGGFAGTWTKDELGKIILRHLQQQNRYLSKLVINQKFGAERARLLAEDPAMYQILEDRLNDLAGKAGPLAEIQNKVVDRVLAPVLGPNSASKIASVSNELMMHFNMAGLNLAQPILNALTFTQTVLPEIAFVMNAVPERLAPYYGVWPVAGSDGLVRGSVHALDPLRLMKKSFAEMGKPSDELFKHFERASSEGIVSPRLVEEYIGESSSNIKNLRKAISSGENFVGWLKAVSESALAGSEKLSRGNGFTVGHILGRDFMGLKDEQLYQFAKKFTQRTMYNYGTADRSRIFTTPAGSMLGLFKNWMFHYMGAMAQYTDEALNYGNFAPLLWQTAGTAAVGGLAATGPMYFMADQFSKMANDKSLMSNTYDLMGGVNPISDAAFFGLPTLLGASLSGSSSQPGGNPVRDATQIFSFAHLDRMNALSKAVGTSIDSWSATGRNPITNANVRDQFARALLPKTVYRVVGAWEDKAIRSLSSSHPQFKNVSLGDRVMYMSGLNPTFVERGYRVADELWKDKEKMNTMVHSMGQNFYEAQKANDKYVMNQIMMKAMANGMDFSRVLRSSSSIMAKDQQDAIERKFSVEKIWERRHMMQPTTEEGN